MIPKKKYKSQAFLPEFIKVSLETQLHYGPTLAALIHLLEFKFYEGKVKEVTDLEIYTSNVGSITLVEYLKISPHKGKRSAWSTLFSQIGVHYGSGAQFDLACTNGEDPFKGKRYLYYVSHGHKGEHYTVFLRNEKVPILPPKDGLYNFVKVLNGVKNPPINDICESAQNPPIRVHKILPLECTKSPHYTNVKEFKETKEENPAGFSPTTDKLESLYKTSKENSSVILEEIQNPENPIQEVPMAKSTIKITETKTTTDLIQKFGLVSSSNNPNLEIKETEEDLRDYKLYLTTTGDLNTNGFYKMFKKAVINLSDYPKGAPFPMQPDTLKKAHLTKFVTEFTEIFPITEMPMFFITLAKQWKDATAFAKTKMGAWGASEYCADIMHLLKWSSAYLTWYTMFTSSKVSGTLLPNAGTSHSPFGTTKLPNSTLQTSLGGIQPSNTLDTKGVDVQVTKKVEGCEVGFTYWNGKKHHPKSGELNDTYEELIARAMRIGNDSAVEGLMLTLKKYSVDFDSSMDRITALVNKG